MEKTSVALDVAEIITGITAFKIVMDNTALELDQLHDMTQTFLSGIRDRLGKVEIDIETMDSVGQELTEISSKYATLKAKNDEDIAFFHTVIKAAKAQESKRGKHKKLKDIMEDVAAEMEATKNATVQHAELDE